MSILLVLGVGAANQYSPALKSMTKPLHSSVFRDACIIRDIDHEWNSSYSTCSMGRQIPHVQHSIGM